MWQSFYYSILLSNNAVLQFKGIVETTKVWKQVIVVNNLTRSTILEVTYVCTYVAIELCAQTLLAFKVKYKGLHFKIKSMHIMLS